MNQEEAFADTLKLAEKNGMPELPGSSLGLAHLRDMKARIDKVNYSDAKVGRWLGWAQCAVVAANIGVTLEDMEALNLSHAGGGSNA